jgi:hypothetical protein
MTMDHGEQFHGHEEHGLGEVWGVVGTLVVLAVAAFLLLRNDAARARLLAALKLLRDHPVVRALLHRVRPEPAETPSVARPDLARLEGFPVELRDAVARVDDLAAGVDVPRSGTPWPDRALAEHRLESVRAAVADLVDTLAEIPLDVALEPDPSTGRSAVEDAVATAAVLERELHDLRREIHAGLAARLRHQRTFVTGKYQRPDAPSTLDLS